MKLSRIVKVKVGQADIEEKDDFEELSPQNETKKANYQVNVPLHDDSNQCKQISQI